MRVRQALYAFILACKKRFVGINNQQVCGRVTTIPNAITTAGVVGIGVYCWLFLTDTATFLIPIVNVGIVLSDIFDGIAADKLNQHSAFGKFLDPLRDRMHTGALLLNVVVLGARELWIALVILIGAELWIGGLGLLACATRYGIAGGVHSVGKARAATHWSAVLLILMQHYWLSAAFISPMLLVNIMATASVYAALFYTFRACRMFKGVPSRAYESALR